MGDENKRALLLVELKNIHEFADESGDLEAAHSDADDALLRYIGDDEVEAAFRALLRYIGDDEVEAAFRAIPKW